VAHDNPGILHLLDPDDNPGRRGGGGGAPPGLAVYQQNCQVCHGADRLGTDNGAPLVYAAADPANNIAVGAPRVDAAGIRAILATGKGRMPAFAHLSAADIDNVVTFLTTPAGGRGGFAGGGGGRGRGAAPAGPAPPPELIAGSGSAWTRPESGRGRGAAMPYPEGTPEFTKYTINEYNTVANRLKPPFTSIVKYDLNEPTIKWRVPFGDDPALAARGITGTGSPATNNGLVITQAGLVFGVGRDNHVRAWDSDTGKELWSSRFTGNFTGSPVMYEMGGKQYLLVPAASGAGRGRGAAPAAPPAGGPQGTPAATGPVGWIAYTLPGR
jgi:quinoprotein glucose dehydrogenase